MSVVAQTGAGLAAGLTSVFTQFPGRRTIAFNSDSPHLPRSVLEDAFETLATHDVVVGPTHDGGYYLVGAKARTLRFSRTTEWVPAVRSKDSGTRTSSRAIRRVRRSFLRY